MDVHLNSEIEQIVSHKVASGEYQSPSDLVSEAVRLLEERDQVRAEVRNKIEAGWQSIQAGRMTDGEAFFDEMDAELDEIDRRGAV